MKVNKKLVDIRRENILNLINERKEISVNEIADIFNISNLTARRDLDELYATGKIQRFHGGARINNENLFPINTKKQEIKENIAKMGAGYICEGDIIFINSSSTALLTLKYIVDKHVTVITNNADALYIDIDPKINIMLTGGKISFPKRTLTGAFTINNLKSIKADKVILGISGFDINEGITTSVIEEVEVNRYMLHNSSVDRIILAESYKFGHIDNFKSSSINSVTKVVTDYNIDLSYVRKLEKLGIKVVLA